MPTLEVTTKKAEVVWKSPDGQRVLFGLELDYNGETVQAKTYSKDISVEGWTGTVETYEKEGKFGAETFVKQPQKEGGYSGGGGGRSYGGGKAMADPFTMYLSYAKDLVVAHVTAQTRDGASMTLEDSIQATLTYGKTLYEGRPEATTAATDTVVQPTDAELKGDMLKDIDAVFGKDEEKPWAKPKA